MLKLGQYNLLQVLSEKTHGFYLDGGSEWGRVLLPKKQAPVGLKLGDEVSVFVHFDSEDLIIATTTQPKALVGDFARLKVLSNESVGAFLDWGLDKDLFVPHREQIFPLKVGESYIFYVYVDSSQRIAATPRLNKHLTTDVNELSAGQEVKLLVYQQTDLGFKAVINNKYSGLIFKDDLVNHLQLGSEVSGFVKKIRSDGKVDLSLRPLLKESKRSLTDRILIELKENNGRINMSAKSSAELVNEKFNVSRKKFKVALGDLYKKKLIGTDQNTIWLNKK